MKSFPISQTSIKIHWLGLDGLIKVEYKQFFFD